MKQGKAALGEIEIARECLVFENQYIKIYNDEVLFPSGYSGTYVRISSHTNQSVGVLPVTADGNLVLIRTFRHAARGWGYEVTKGEVSVGEKPEEAARRELLEETGYTAGKLIDLGEVCESPAIFSGRMRCYLALDCVTSECAHPELTEAISGVRIFSADSYFDDRTADFTDAITQLLILKYLYRGE